MHRSRRVVGVGSGLSLVLLLGVLHPSTPLADAAFSARTSTVSNTWSAAVLVSRVITAVQVYDTPEPSGWYRRSGVSVNIAATQQTRRYASAVSYSINGGPTTTTPGVSVTPRVERQGVNTVTYYGTDQAGAKEAPRTTEVKLDNQAPTLTVTSPTGDLTHAQWQTTCPQFPSTGGLCGAVDDGPGSGITSVRYTLSRSADGRCFDGTRWVGSACRKPVTATLADDAWFASVPDETLDRPRAWYTMTIFATDLAGIEKNTTRSFSIG